MTRKITSMCQMCGKPTWKKPNAKYCHSCVKILAEKGAKRYKIGGGVVEVWVRGGIVKATLNGQECVVEFIRKELSS